MRRGNLVTAGLALASILLPSTLSPNRRVLAIFARVRGSEKLQMRVEYTRR